MKTFATTSAIAVALTAGVTAASAGNTEEPVVTAAPVAPVVVPVDTTADWTGFYAGGSLGYADASEDFDDDGVTYGAHAGYDYDFGTFVLGGEVEASGFDLSDGGVDADSVLRAKVRAGYDAGAFLPYVTAGIAQLNTGGALDGDDTGAVYGVGVDYAYTDTIRIGGEVLQHEFDNFDNTGADIDATTAAVRLSFEF